MGTDLLNHQDKQRLWLWERLLPILLAILVPLGLFMFVWARASEARKRNGLVERLNRLPASYSVTIDSVEVGDGSVVVGALKDIADIPAHHSGPIEPRLIRIKTDQHVIDVCLERDSERTNEYWVSMPREGKCGDQAFGRPYFGGLTTDRLASYWSRASR